MKKFIKIIRNSIGKILLKLLIKLKKFTLLPQFVKLFPKETYRASFQLMKRGYLNLAYEIVKNYTPKEHEVHLKHRIESMMEIRDKGLGVNKIQKKNITELNVLFCVHNSLPYDQAGYAMRTHHVAMNLQKEGVGLHVATRPGYPWDLQKHRERTGRDKSDSINGIEYIRLSDSSKTFKKGADSNYISVYADALVKVAKQNYTTIIHGHSNYLNGLAAIQAADRLAIPSIYEVRGLWHKTRLTLDANYRNAGMFAYESSMVKNAIQAADAVVTISNPLKKLMESWGTDPAKIHVIPNAVDTTRFSPQARSARLVERYNLQDKTVIGFIGSITGYEGLKELVWAVDELIDEGLDIVLMIVGDGKEKANLERLAKSKNIIFTGRVPFEEVKEYYTLFDICPFPRNDFEICRYVPPLKILEAMAMKKAIIISDLAPLLEIIEDGKNGLVCKVDNLESLKTSILQLYQDISLRERLGEKAREWVEAHRSWDDISEKYIKLYNSFRDGHT